MEKFVTIATFQYPHEAHVIKTKLESVGIFVLLKDELTVQAHHFLSNAVGGVKLQIKESDCNTALLILKEVGLLKEDTKVAEDVSGYLYWLNSHTNQLPIIRNWPLEIRGIFIIGICLALVIAFLFFFSLPSKEERLQVRKKAMEAALESKLRDYHLPVIDSLIDTDPKKAIHYAKYLLKTEYPKNDRLYLEIGYAYIEMDSFKPAIQNLNASMTYGYRHPHGLSAVAYCLVQTKDYDGAIRNLKEAIEMNKDYEHQLAEVYELREDWENAELDYSKYIADRESWDLTAKRNKAFLKLKQKRDEIRKRISKQTDE